MVTPEWAKRKFTVEGEEGVQRMDGLPAPPQPYQEDHDIPTAGRPLHRGNVARRLDEVSPLTWQPPCSTQHDKIDSCYVPMLLVNRLLLRCLLCMAA